eukprot:s21_g23.t1
MSNETQATQVENEENHDARDGPAVSADGTGVRSSRSLPAKRHEGREGVNGLDSTRAASADASKLGQKADGDLNCNEGEGSPKDNVSKDWLVFRMCEVHAAPRLPHVAAQDWTVVAESAEQMKFGVCKFGQMPNVGPKDRERWHRIKMGQLKPHTAPLPRRPRVPPAPRRKEDAARVFRQCFGKGGDLTISVEADGAQRDFKVIKEFSAPAVEFFLKFLYSGWLEAHGETLIEVGLLADKYQVDELQKAVCKLLASEITPKDACRLCEFADRHGATAAKQIAIDQILREPEDSVYRFEALQSAQLLGHGLLDEILDSGALCLEPGELMPIVLTLELELLSPLSGAVERWNWGLGESPVDLRRILEKAYIQREIAAMEDTPFMKLQPLANEVNCWSILQECRQKCKRGEHTTDALYSLWERYEAAFDGELRPPFLGYWDRTLDSQVWTEKHGTIQDGQVVPCRADGPVRWFRLCMRKGSLEKAEFCLQGILQSAPPGTVPVLIEAPVPLGKGDPQVTEQIGDAPYQGPLLFRPPNKRRKWQGRGPFGGNSIVKQNWPRQMIPIDYKKKWERREKLGETYHGSCGSSSQFTFSILLGFNHPTPAVLTAVCFMWPFFLTFYRHAGISISVFHRGRLTLALRKHRYAFRKHGYELDVPKLGG